MNRICRKINPYRCKVCNQDMLFFMTKHNTLIDYKALIERSEDASTLKKYLILKDVQYIKCITCNKIYLIDWSNHIPVPLTDKSHLTKFGV